MVYWLMLKGVMGWFKEGDDGFAMFLVEGFFWFENGGSFLS